MCSTHPQLPETDYTILNANIEENCTKQNLQCTPFFLEKIQQVRLVVLFVFMFTLTQYSMSTVAKKARRDFHTDVRARRSTR